MRQRSLEGRHRDASVERPHALMAAVVGASGLNGFPLECHESSNEECGGGVASLFAQAQRAGP